LDVEFLFGQAVELQMYFTEVEGSDQEYKCA